jgi:hypothetical protein
MTKIILNRQPRLTRSNWTKGTFWFKPMDSKGEFRMAVKSQKTLTQNEISFWKQQQGIMQMYGNEEYSTNRKIESIVLYLHNTLLECDFTFLQPYSPS